VRMENAYLKQNNDATPVIPIHLESDIPGFTCRGHVAETDLPSGPHTRSPSEARSQVTSNTGVIRLY